MKIVKDWPVLKTEKDIRSFIGLTSFYRVFIPDFAGKAAILTDLYSGKRDTVKKRTPVKITWTDAP